MIRRTVAALALIAALVVPVIARGPSTTKERERALDVIRKLEVSPMDPALSKDRDWVFQWLKEVPDVDVRVCSVIVRPLQRQKNSPERNVLLLQNMLANAAFTMQNPDRKANSVEGYMAATEGMIRAYQNLVAKDSTKKNEFMESLVAKQQEGTLMAYVKKGAAECAKHSETVLQP